MRIIPRIFQVYRLNKRPQYIARTHEYERDTCESNKYKSTYQRLCVQPIHYSQVI